jgi:hypothetical protein
MVPSGKIAITLSSEEVERLRARLEELITRSDREDFKTPESIRQKLRVAQEKML